jgi:trimethylguanosine synthase
VRTAQGSKANRRSQTARHIVEYAPPSKTILIDCFCGVGGNTIAFAKSNQWDQVIGIDVDPGAITCAKNNARVYGVEDSIRFINGDCFEVLREQFGGMRDKLVIFASPPWGGPDYAKFQVFNLKAMQPYDTQHLVRELSAFSTELVLFLPRNSNLNQLAEYAKDGSKVQVVHYCVHGSSKVSCGRPISPGAKSFRGSEFSWEGSDIYHQLKRMRRLQLASLVLADLIAVIAAWR